LISALGQIDDVARAVTMDLKAAGNHIYIVGATHSELGGSHFSLVRGLKGGHAPRVDPVVARQTFQGLHRAISAGLVRACHDLSEGGLAVAIAEMAFAGGLGARIDLAKMPHDLRSDSHADTILLFSESNTRFLCEVPSSSAGAFEKQLAGIPHAAIGKVIDEKILGVSSAGTSLVAADLAALKAAWQAPLDWS
jgi:phosphoribosylformylglycinamidine synthase